MKAFIIAVAIASMVLLAYKIVIGSQQMIDDAEGCRQIGGILVKAEHRGYMCIDYQHPKGH
jgi:hypothetical protein